MLRLLEGIVARRILVNFRADPRVVRALVPAPLEVVTQSGAAVVGVCLIRLSQLRPKGLPGFVGLASDSMAHRVAVRCPTPEGPRDGVFVWQRHSDNALLTLLDGRVYPGVHDRARFHAVEGESGLTVEAFTGRSHGDVSIAARRVPEWTPTPLFPTLETARAFFARGDGGVSCGVDGHRLETVRLRALEWSMSPLAVSRARVAFFEDRRRFPEGSVALDGAVLMHGIPHEWHELSVVPELAVVETVAATRQGSGLDPGGPTAASRLRRGAPAATLLDMSDVEPRTVPAAEEAARRRSAETDRVRMRCPVCETPADWAGQKWRCRRCGWLAS